MTIDKEKARELVKKLKTGSGLHGTRWADTQMAESANTITALLAEVERLEGENERLTTKNLEWLRGWNEQHEQLTKAEAERDALKKDAERYYYCKNILYADDSCCDDGPIDAAMKGEK